MCDTPTPAHPQSDYLIIQLCNRQRCLHQAGNGVAGLGDQGGIKAVTERQDDALQEEDRRASHQQKGRHENGTTAKTEHDERRGHHDNGDNHTGGTAEQLVNDQVIQFEEQVASYRFGKSKSGGGAKSGEGTEHQSSFAFAACNFTENLGDKTFQHDNPSLLECLRAIAVANEGNSGLANREGLSYTVLQVVRLLAQTSQV